jgi:hypothetical protein
MSRVLVDLHSFGMLHSIDWYLVTDFLGQPICPILKSQAVQEDKFYKVLACSKADVSVSYLEVFILRDRISPAECTVCHVKCDILFCSAAEWLGRVLVAQSDTKFMYSL